MFSDPHRVSSCAPSSGCSRSRTPCATLTTAPRAASRSPRPCIVRAPSRARLYMLTKSSADADVRTPVPVRDRRRVAHVPLAAPVRARAVPVQEGAPVRGRGEHGDGGRPAVRPRAVAARLRRRRPQPARAVLVPVKARRKLLPPSRKSASSRVRPCLPCQKLHALLSA
jgi:hypothetical protein